MLKMVAAGVTALFLSASPVVYAQASSDEVMERSSAANLSALTDARINIVKATLQLTPDQERFGRLLKTLFAPGRMIETPATAVTAPGITG